MIIRNFPNESHPSIQNIHVQKIEKDAEEELLRYGTLAAGDPYGTCPIEAQSELVPSWGLRWHMLERGARLGIMCGN